jgi:hypothetical protein
MSFLTLRELAVALAVNKEWTAAVQSMRPAMLTADISSATVPAMTASRLRRHVGELSQLDQFQRRKLKLSSNDLHALSDALSQLRSLYLRLNVLPGGPLLQFPARLQLLGVALDGFPDLQANTALLTSIGQLQQLHTLWLKLNDGRVTLAPLQQLLLLRDLHLDMPLKHTSEQLAADLRALPWLHRLCVVGQAVDSMQSDRAALLHALLREEPAEQLRALQWRDLRIASLSFSDELAALLLRLPSLEHLAAYLSGCTRFDFLAALPRLTSLELDMWTFDDEARRNMLAIFTSNGLVRLHALQLSNGPFSGDDLVQLLSHTPALTSLKLHGLLTVSSLSFFRELPKLTQSLTTLMVGCSHRWRLTAADLPPLLVLQQLRELRLIQWPDELVDSPTADDRAPFEQRPCAVLPKLELFRWVAD